MSFRFRVCDDVICSVAQGLLLLVLFEKKTGSDNLSRTDEPMPEYIRVMIDRFNKSKNTTTQTDWNQQETPDEVEIQPSPEVLRKIRKQQTTDDVIADSEPERQAQRAVRLCVVCGKAKFDVSGIFRMIFSDGICHICRGRI